MLTGKGYLKLNVGPRVFLLLIRECPNVLIKSEITEVVEDNDTSHQM